MTIHDIYNIGLTINPELSGCLNKHDYLPAMKLLGKIWVDKHYITVPSYVLKCETMLEPASSSLSFIKDKAYEYMPSVNSICLKVNSNIITNSSGHMFTYNSFIRSITFFLTSNNGVTAHTNNINTLYTLPYICESNVTPL